MYPVCCQSRNQKFIFKSDNTCIRKCSRCFNYKIINRRFYRTDEYVTSWAPVGAKNCRGDPRLNLFWMDAVIVTSLNIPDNPMQICPFEDLVFKCLDGWSWAYLEKMRANQTQADFLPFSIPLFCWWRALGVCDLLSKGKIFIKTKINDAPLWCRVWPHPELET